MKKNHNGAHVGHIHVASVLNCRWRSKENFLTTKKKKTEAEALPWKQQTLLTHTRLRLRSRWDTEIM